MDLANHVCHAIQLNVITILQISHVHVQGIVSTFPSLFSKNNSHNYSREVKSLSQVKAITL